MPREHWDFCEFVVSRMTALEEESWCAQDLCGKDPLVFWDVLVAWSTDATITDILRVKKPEYKKRYNQPTPIKTVSGSLFIWKLFTHLFTIIQSIASDSEFYA